jgi:hypothetical protein
MAPTITIVKKSDYEMLKKIYGRIDAIYDGYKDKFFGENKEKRLTPYEKALGYTEHSRMGSRKFCNAFGNFIEEILDISPLFTRKSKNGDFGGCDGYNEETYFEVKSRHDTMKQSMAYPEIKPKLEYAISKGKKFNLLVLTDKCDNDRNIPLHSGGGLTNIKDVDGYDANNHRWISGSNIYELIFGENGTKIKKYILGKLETNKIC